MKEKECDGCGNPTSRKSLGRKVRGEYLCKKCKVEKREEHRKKTIEDAGIGNELREMGNKMSRESARKSYRKRVGRMVRNYGDYENNEVPVPKGSKIKVPKQRNSCYLTLQEKQNYLRILMDRGLDFNVAKNRIGDLIQSQKDLRKKMKKENKTEEEIKTMHEKLIEGLLQ